MPILPTLLKTGYRVYKLSKKFDKKVLYLDPTNKFIQKYVPPGYRKQAFKIYKYAQFAIAGGVLYDVINELTGGTSYVKPPAYQPEKERSRFFGNYSGKYKYASRYNNKYCRPSRPRRRRRSYHR